MKKIVDLKSGHKLTVNLASLEECQELMHVLAAELRAVNLDISQGVLQALMQEDKMGAMMAVAGTDADIVWKTITTILASRPIKGAIYVCAAHCMLNASGPDERIEPKSFEPEKARRDYYPVMLEVMKASLLPFFEDLGSGLLTRAKPGESNQK